MFTESLKIKKTIKGILENEGQLKEPVTTVVQDEISVTSLPQNTLHVSTISPLMISNS